MESTPAPRPASGRPHTFHVGAYIERLHATRERTECLLARVLADPTQGGSQGLVRTLQGALEHSIGLLEELLDELRREVERLSIKTPVVVEALEDAEYGALWLVRALSRVRADLDEAQYHRGARGAACDRAQEALRHGLPQIADALETLELELRLVTMRVERGFSAG